MGKVIRLDVDPNFVKAAQDFLDQVKAGEVTQGAMIYCLKDGGMEWRILGVNDMTYMIGLLTRLQRVIMQTEDSQSEFVDLD